MPKQAIVTMNAGVDAGRLSVSFDRQFTGGNTLVVPFDEFQKMSATAIANLVDTVAFDNSPRAKRGFDLTAANIAEVPAGARVGRVEPGLYENDAFALAQVADADGVAAGDAVGWEQFGDTVSNTGSQFAGIALAAAADGEYVWVQVDGWVAEAATSDGADIPGDAAEGDLLAWTADGNLTTAGVDDTAVAISMGTEGVSIVRSVRRQNWFRS